MKKKKEITKKEFNALLDEMLTFEEMCNLNTAIYFRPEHIDYYINYHCEKYNFCLEYLEKHRHLLSNK